MTLWTAVHLGVSPSSPTIQALDEWQIGLIYEVAMNYPVEGLRRSYFERENGAGEIDEEALRSLGYSPEQIAEIKESLGQ